MPTSAAATAPRRFRLGLGEVSGAVADLGVFVPLAAALVLVNGLDAGSLLIAAGMLVIASGAWFGIPFPVQPLKALTAVAVARQLGPEVIAAAGLLIGGVLVLLSFRRIADVVARLFTRTVVRALQVGVGVLLVLTAARLVLSPPAVFAATPPTPWPLLLGIGALVVVAQAARTGRHAVALLLLVAGVAAALVGGTLPPPRALTGLSLPGLPPSGAFVTAFFLLVVPQIPLTFGNAVVAVTDVSRGYFGPVASRVTPSRVCRSAGVGNVVSALVGGMPMCHGSSGLTASYRLGARTAGTNLLLGGAFVVAGVLYGPQVPALLGLLPVWALAAFLAYAGIRHALLVADLRGWRLVLAVGAGLVGAALGNLAVTTAVTLVVELGVKVRARLRPPAPVAT